MISLRGKLVFILFLFSVCSINVSAQTIVSDVSENESHVVDHENIIFAGHATAFWDGNRKTEKATRETLMVGKRNDFYRIATVAEHMMEDPYLVNLHYFSQQDVDLVGAKR